MWITVGIYFKLSRPAITNSFSRCRSVVTRLRLHLACFLSLGLQTSLSEAVVSLWIDHDTSSFCNGSASGQDSSRQPPQ